MSFCVFQSTHPHGMRLILGWFTYNQHTFQSTHPHGMRRLLHRSLPTLLPFQSTHPHGMRLRTGDYDVVIVPFQSTHPHGMRHRSRGGRGCATSFNPRTHMGCDSINSSFHEPSTRFQSTHPHGMRLPICKLLNLSIFDLRYRENTKNQ